MTEDEKRTALREIYGERRTICRDCTNNLCRVKQNNGCRACGNNVIKKLWWSCPEGKFSGVKL